MPAKKRARKDAEREAEASTSVAATSVAAPPALTATRSRRDTQRGVAERRAAHFARPDDPAVENNLVDTVDRTREHWPGPFSTAMRMIDERENAKLARETIMAMKMTEAIETGDLDENLDTYDKMLKSAKDNLAWKIEILDAVFVQKSLPSLVSLSVTTLADHFELVEDMGDLPPDLRGLIALEVSKRRKLNSRALLAIVPAVVSSIVIPDCSAVSEEGLDICFQNSVLMPKKFNGDDGSAQSILQTVSLHNCGSCFTDKIANSLAKVVDKLEVLSLKGCFKLSDSALAQFLNATPMLRSLDLSCNLRFRHDSLRAVASLSKLTSLSLDKIAYLKDSDIEILHVPTMRHLTELSVCGLILITTASLSKLTLICCDSLLNLNIKGCVAIDAEMLRQLRTHNLQIIHLDISGIPSFSTADLLMFFSPLTWEKKSISSKLRSRAEFQSLRLENLYSLVDDVLIQLCVVNSNSLRTLSVRGCAKLSGRMCMALIFHCSESLNEVDFSFVRDIPEYAALEVISKCTELKTVHCWGCSQFSRMFRKCCEQRHINVVGYLDKND